MNRSILNRHTVFSILPKLVIHYTFCAGPNDKVYNDTTRYIYKRVSQ